jgi:glutamate formiminotransferase/formiminotetrahydrofolate cyclodeaminase
MPRLVECVPNFSEGRDRGIIDAIAQAIAGVDGVTLLDVDPGAATHRTVFTFVGTPEAVTEGAVRGAHKAAALIDMSQHKGAHPRIGALDVLPIVPVSGVTMDECVQLARTLGCRLANELQMPVYFYEHAATRDDRRSLATIRAGEYEGLQAKLADPAWTPDCGPAVFNARLGATVVGAREFLIAYNVNLNTRDKRLAHDIALAIREIGRQKKPGRLKAVRAIGWYIEEYRQAQVSINLLDYRTTPLHVVFETVREEADRLGLLVTGSELVGLTPLQPMVDAGRFYFRRQGKSTGAPEHELVEMAVRSLGLNQLNPFPPEKKIIEYAVRPPAPLMSSQVERFVADVSSSSPAPGGGSVAALAGSLAAALAAMVANLTVGKSGYEEATVELSTLAERAQATRQALGEAVDADTRAFTALMEVMRMPRATAEQQAARDVAVEAATRAAAEVPRQTARLSLDALDLASRVAVIGHNEAISDAGVAALLARAAVEGAGLNVLINVRSMHDEEFKRTCRAETGQLIDRARSICDEVVTRVHAQLS